VSVVFFLKKSLFCFGMSSSTRYSSSSCKSCSSLSGGGARKYKKKIPTTKKREKRVTRIKQPKTGISPCFNNNNLNKDKILNVLDVSKKIDSKFVFNDSKEIAKSVVFHKNYRIATEYTKVKTLGKGGFGKAELFKNKMNKELVVVKSMTDPEFSTIERTITEYCILKSIYNRVQETLISGTLPDYLKLYQIGKTLYIIMTFCEGVELHKYKPKTYEDRKKCINAFISDIGSALAIINACGYIHGDIKPQNILYNAEHKRHYLIDFNFTCSVFQNIQHCAYISGDNFGTGAYMSPDMYTFNIKKDPQKLKYNDLWSFGALLFELYFDRPFLSLDKKYEKNIDGRWSYDDFHKNHKEIIATFFNTNMPAKTTEFDDKILTILLNIFLNKSYTIEALLKQYIK
jgi:serine/threonine protein kinase